MTDQQKQESAQLISHIARAKGLAFDLLLCLLREPEQNLRHAGYKSLDDATRKIVTRTAKEIEKLIQTHERKWP